MARAGTPPAAELERIGVARISIASGATLAVMSLIKKIGEELRATGRFDVLEHSINRAEVQKLFTRDEHDPEKLPTDDRFSEDHAQRKMDAAMKARLDFRKARPRPTRR